MYDIAPYIAGMSPETIEKVRKFEAEAMTQEQVPIQTIHVLHAGMYARKIILPAGVRLTGALIKIATMLIIEGCVIAFTEEGAVRLRDTITPARANRKQAFLAETDTSITMIFPTNAKTVEEAEDQFTDEGALLFSRKMGANNHIIVTGE